MQTDQNGYPKTRWDWELDGEEANWSVKEQVTVSRSDQEVEAVAFWSTANPTRNLKVLSLGCR